MKLLLLMTCVILTATSCGSMSADHMYRSKVVAGSMGVNQYGYITMGNGKAARCAGAVTPEDMLKNVTKAMEWDKQEKTTDIHKDIDSYVTCGMSVKYHYAVATKSSLITICYRDMQYSYIDSFECESFNDFEKLAAELKTSDLKVKDLKAEMESANRLK